MQYAETTVGNVDDGIHPQESRVKTRPTRMAINSIMPSIQNSRNAKWNPLGKNSSVISEFSTAAWNRTFHASASVLLQPNASRSSRPHSQASRPNPRSSLSNILSPPDLLIARALWKFPMTGKGVKDDVFKLEYRFRCFRFRWAKSPPKTFQSHHSHQSAQGFIIVRVLTFGSLSLVVQAGLTVLENGIKSKY
ncbi:hypothetical protein ACLOJK_011212 [Asimina triloba]